MKKKIYIIEDNEKNLELFVAVLATIPNLEILTSATGRDGLNLIYSSNPDIILLDIQLPDISGTDICKQLRKDKKFNKTPIIAVTSFAMKGDKERILESGFNDYISKPLLIKNFREKIQNLLRI
ncbi:response regulator [Promethearchaeum syntrophicum]|uniref:Response regulator n=1 Tax=Promethearchaeum syntrophicum TaxID=2594042 RepID=A0A5B9DBV3_9ARCH|nr:response regulator [Candidatus Prometheoarchaeum syntrophicum]